MKKGFTASVFLGLSLLVTACGDARVNNVVKASTEGTCSTEFLASYQEVQKAATDATTREAVEGAVTKAQDFETKYTGVTCQLPEAMHATRDATPVLIDARAKMDEAIADLKGRPLP